MKKRYHIHNIFWNFLSSYLLLLIFPTIFSVVFYNQSTDMAEKTEIKNRLNSLQQVQNNLDHYLNSCNSLAVSLKYEMYKKNMPSFKKPEPGASGLYRFIQDVDQFTNRYAFDGNTVLKPMVLMKNDDMVFKDNSVIYGLDFFYNNTLSYANMDYETWHDLVFGLTQPFFIPSQSMKIDGIKTRALTYVYPMYAIGSTQDSCLMQFVLYEKDLHELLSVANTDNNGLIFLLQLDGSRLGWQGNQFEDIPLDVSRMELENGSFTLNFQDTKYFIVYSKSSSKNILLVSALPEAAVFEKAIKIKHTMLLAIVVYLSIGFIGCLSFARRNSKPIKNLSNNIKSLVKNDQYAFASNKIKNEYDYLTHGIYQLAEKMDTTTRNAQENYLLHLFSGAGQVKSTLLQMGEELEIDLKRADYFSVAIIQFAQREFLYAALNRCKAAMLSAQEEKGTFFFCTTEDNQIAVLFLSSYDNHEAWTMKVLFDLYSHLPEPARMGIGKTYNDIMDIQFSYSQAVYAVSNAEQDGNESILTYEKMESTLNLLFYPINLEYKLVNWVKSGSVEELEEAFEQIYYQNFRCKKLTPRMFKLLTDNIQATLLKIYEECGMNDSYEELVSQLNRVEGWDEKFNILKERFMAFSTSISNRKNQRSQDQKQKFLAYIEEQYGNSLLCVAEMAKEFDLSESYFSQLFKELTGNTFSAYLENLRIKKACDLMSVSKAAEIEQITQEVGYNNSNTFRRAFKRVMGVAPSSYKWDTAAQKNSDIL